jgi:cytochrome c
MAADKGADLFKKNGCVACHGLGAKEAKKMGPNFSAVSDKYKNDAASIDKLAKKIRAGGKGSFGQIPMPPMAQVSEADAKELAKYALAFKGK